MNLTQKKGKQFDSLKITGSRLEHEWCVGRESGSRSVDIANLDYEIGNTVHKTEGKLPYFVLSLIPMLYVITIQTDSLLTSIIWALMCFTCLFFLVVCVRIPRKEELDLICLNDGNVFAVIRHSWIGEKERSEFIAQLQTAIMQSKDGSADMGVD